LLMYTNAFIKTPRNPEATLPVAPKGVND
jgi:hypothetical protein